MALLRRQTVIGLLLVVISAAATGLVAASAGGGVAKPAARLEAALFPGSSRGVSGAFIDLQLSSHSPAPARFVIYIPSGWGLAAAPVGTLIGDLTSRR